MAKGTIRITKKKRYHYVALPVAWTEIVDPQRGDLLVLRIEGKKLVIELEKKG